MGPSGPDWASLARQVGGYGVTPQSQPLVVRATQTQGGAEVIMSDGTTKLLPGATDRDVAAINAASHLPADGNEWGAVICRYIGPEDGIYSTDSVTNNSETVVNIENTCTEGSTMVAEIHNHPSEMPVSSDHRPGYGPFSNADAQGADSENYSNYPSGGYSIYVVTPSGDVFRYDPIPIGRVAPVFPGTPAAAPEPSWWKW